jgi:hypothetical protein
MFTKFRIALSLAFVLGAASPALGEHTADEPGGHPNQTWCDVNPACNGWAQRMHRPPDENNAPGIVASPNLKHRPSQKHGAHDH